MSKSSQLGNLILHLLFYSLNKQIPFPMHNSSNSLPKPGLDYKKRVQVTHECLRGILEGEVAMNVSSLNTLEAVNNDAIIKYRDLEVYCKEIVRNTSSNRKLETQLVENIDQLEKAEKEMDKLLVLANQLDIWSKRVLEVTLSEGKRTR